MSDAAERLRRRYPKSRMPRPLLVALIGVGVVLALTWLIWTALRHSQPVARPPSRFSGAIPPYQLPAGCWLRLQIFSRSANGKCPLRPAIGKLLM
jgi:hypothetical protein